MGNRNKTREFHWRGVFKQQSSSGLSIAAFCRQESISPPSFYLWRRKLRERKALQDKQVGSTKSSRAGRNPNHGSQLLPVRIEGTASTLRIHLPQEGIFVDVPQGTKRETVTSVLQAVREASSC